MVSRKFAEAERDRTLKIIKRILQIILILIMALCAFILICAFNPSLTEKIAEQVTDEEQVDRTDRENVKELLNTGVYVPPAQEDVSSPESVKDRNGYEPVWEDGQQITDEDAESIQEDLETGDTGEQFKFDTQFYPYYGMLDKDMKTLYRQIYANAMEVNTSFSPVVTVTAKQVKDVFEAVYNDHPELFWLETGYSCKYLQSGECIEVTLQYHRIAADLETAKEEFEAAAEKILVEAKRLSTDTEKEKYVHDALIEMVEYHAGTIMNQSAYSALVTGRSVCAGYARAFQYLMIELGIPCYYCTGYSGQNHAWNIVMLGDEYYNVDVTWDDTNPATNDYFNKTDADYAKTHMRQGLSVKLPVCNGEEYRVGSSGNASQDSSDSESTDEDILDAEAEDIINSNPQDPLEWTGNDAEKVFERELEEAGILEEEILDTLDEYYADCLAQMKKVGTGQKQFTNVIPKSLWSTIEQVYSDGSYEEGYVDEALEQMKMDNFAIQLQTERLSGKYYRLYHNISTWEDE